MNHTSTNPVLRGSWRGVVAAASALLLAPIGALAQPTAPVPPKTDEETVKMVEFFVSGKGESRATNSISPTDIELSIPGVAAEKLLSKIPGISVVANDPFGFYEFGNNIRVRAFNIDKLAVSIDGVPLGNNDPRYGTPVGRLIDSENLTTIKVSQGAGDVTTPAYEALGGSLQFFTKDPEKELGATVSATIGDFAQKRLFAKIETGEIFPGLTANLSASHFEFEPRGLEGIATSQSDRIEAKIKYEMPKASFRYTFTYNDRDDYDTQLIYWDAFQQLKAGNYLGTGKGWENITPFNTPGLGGFDYGNLSDQGRHFGPPTFIVTYNPANPSATLPGEGVNAQYYDQWRNGRMDFFHRVVADFDLSDDLKLKVVPYYQEKRNYGTFGVPQSVAETQIRAAYQGAPTRNDIWAKLWYNAAGRPLNKAGSTVDEFGVPIRAFSNGEQYNPDGTVKKDADGNVILVASSAQAVVAPTATPTTYVAGVPGRAARDENFGGRRYGVSGNLEWKTDKNTLIVGAWVESDYHRAYRPTYNLVGGSITGDFAYDQPLFLNYSRYFNTDIMQGWVQDTFKLMDGKLDLIVGAKALKLDRDVRGFLNLTAWAANTEVKRSVSYHDYFLPQLGALYRISSSTELFFNYSENMATPPSATLSVPSGFVANLLGPEYSKNFDIGVRSEVGSLTYTLQAYYIKYTDRILSVPIPVSAGVGLAGQEAYQNVGGVDSIGAEASAEWKSPVKGLVFTGSLALQETKFQEDLPNGTLSNGSQAYLAIKDKDLGNTPLMTINLDARYMMENGLRFNFGGRFFDKVYVNTLNTQQIPSYTVFEGSAAYTGKKGTKLENYTIAVNVYNVFDQYFFTAGDYTGTSGAVQADQGRQISLTITAKF